MLCIVFKMSPDIIGSQYEKLIVQEPKVALNITGNHHGHTCVIAHGCMATQPRKHPSRPHKPL